MAWTLKSLNCFVSAAWPSSPFCMFVGVHTFAKKSPCSGTGRIRAKSPLKIGCGNIAGKLRIGFSIAHRFAPGLSLLSCLA